MYILYIDHSYADLKKNPAPYYYWNFLVKMEELQLKNHKSVYFLIFQKNHILEDFLNDLYCAPSTLFSLCVTASQKGQCNSGFAFTYAIMNKIGKIMAQFCTIYIDLLELQFTKINMNTISKSISPNCFSCCTKQNELIISIFLARITNKY